MTGNRIASDANRALISLYKALQAGWIPPTSVTKEEYAIVKAKMDEDDPLTAFVGFGCSYSGKWFGGLAKDGNGRNYAQNAHNSLMDKLPHIMGVDFRHTPYDTYTPKGMLVYCDPPYVSATGYGAVGKFDSDHFWDVMREWSRENVVVISEYTAPDDFEFVLSIQTKTDMRMKDGTKEPRTEKLFMHQSIAIHPNIVQGSLFDEFSAGRLT
jgi:DNA adenine methylase